MLTPQDIRDKQFVKAVFGGSDMSTVDDFLEELTEDYAALYKENAILKSKIKVLVEKVEEYRATEDSMRMALLTAQKMGDELVNEAAKQKSTMLAGVEEEVESRRAELTQSAQAAEEKLAAAKAENSAYAARIRETLAQIEAGLAALEAESVLPETPAVPEAAEAASQPEPAPELPAEPAGEAPAPASPIPEDEDDEDATPRPKFDFEDLKFGKNFTREE